MAKFQYENLKVSKSILEARCKVNTADLVKLKIEYDNSGVDVYELITALHEKWRISRKIAGVNGDDNDIAIINTELQSEKLQQARIKNQTLLMHLVPKQEAKNRMLAILGKISEVVQQVIRNVANEQTRNPGKLNNNRMWVEYLTNEYNTTTDLIVKHEMEIKSWEDSGQVKLLKTKLDSASTDSDLDSIILSQREVDLDD